MLFLRAPFTFAMPDMFVDRSIEFHSKDAGFVIVIFFIICAQLATNFPASDALSSKKYCFSIPQTIPFPFRTLLFSKIIALCSCAVAEEVTSGTTHPPIIRRKPVSCLSRRLFYRCFYDSFYSPIDLSCIPMPSPVLSSISGATCSH